MVCIFIVNVMFSICQEPLYMSGSIARLFVNFVARDESYQIFLLGVIDILLYFW